MGLRSFRTALLALSLVPSALAVPAAPAAADAAVDDRRAAIAATLLDRLNVRDIAEGWQKMIVGSLPECGCDEVARARAKLAWRTAVEHAFDAELFRAEMHKALATSFTVKELTEILAFRDTPLGRKLSALEKPQNAEQKDMARAMAELGEAQKALNREPARRKLMEDLVAATGGVDAMVDMLSSISLGTALGAAAATPEGQPRMTQGEIMAMVDGARPTIRLAVGPIVVPATAMLYKSLTVQELKRYRDILLTPLGRKSSQVMLASLRRAMQAQAFAIGARFAKELGVQEM